MDKKAPGLCEQFRVGKRQIKILERRSPRGTQDDLSSALPNHATSLPSADKPTRSIGSNMRRVGQLFVGYIEFNTTGNLLADAPCQAAEYSCQPLPGTLRG